MLFFIINTTPTKRQVVTNKKPVVHNQKTKAKKTKQVAQNQKTVVKIKKTIKKNKKQVVQNQKIKAKPQKETNIEKQQETKKQKEEVREIRAKNQKILRELLAQSIPDQTSDSDAFKSYTPPKEIKKKNFVLPKTKTAFKLKSKVTYKSDKDSVSPDINMEIKSSMEKINLLSEIKLISLSKLDSYNDVVKILAIDIMDKFFISLSGFTPEFVLQTLYVDGFIDYFKYLDPQFNLKQYFLYKIKNRKDDFFIGISGLHDKSKEDLCVIALSFSQLSKTVFLRLGLIVKLDKIIANFRIFHKKYVSLSGNIESTKKTDNLDKKIELFLNLWEVFLIIEKSLQRIGFVKIFLSLMYTDALNYVISILFFNKLLLKLIARDNNENSVEISIEHDIPVLINKPEPKAPKIFCS